MIECILIFVGFFLAGFFFGRWRNSSPKMEEYFTPNDPIRRKK